MANELIAPHEQDDNAMLSQKGMHRRRFLTFFAGTAAIATITGYLFCPPCTLLPFLPYFAALTAPAAN